jgi:hypothetical protein
MSKENQEFDPVLEIRKSVQKTMKDKDQTTQYQDLIAWGEKIEEKAVELFEETRKLYQLEQLVTMAGIHAIGDNDWQLSSLALKTADLLLKQRVVIVLQLRNMGADPTREYILNDHPADRAIGITEALNKFPSLVIPEVIIDESFNESLFFSPGSFSWL